VQVYFNFGIVVILIEDWDRVEGVVGVCRRVRERGLTATSTGTGVP